jgi:hypothetical protein
LLETHRNGIVVSSVSVVPHREKNAAGYRTTACVSYLHAEKIICGRHVERNATRMETWISEKRKFVVLN